MPKPRTAKAASKPAASTDAERLYQLQSTLAARVRSFRMRSRMSGVELSKSSGISKAMLSKIESGERLPSVPVLSALATALGVTVGDLFGGPAAAFEPVHTPAGQGVPVPNPDAGGHAQDYAAEQLGSLNLAGLEIKAMLFTIEKRDQALLPIQFDGFWIDHVLSGELVMRIGSRDFLLKTGDTLTYRGEVPHAIGEVRSTCRVLSLLGLLKPANAAPPLTESAPPARGR